jgi:hypothetical protein
MRVRIMGFHLGTANGQAVEGAPAIGGLKHNLPVVLGPLSNRRGKAALLATMIKRRGTSLGQMCSRTGTKRGASYVALHYEELFRRRLPKY